MGKKRLILFNFIPVLIIHLCFLPFWFSKNVSFITNIASTEIIFDFVIIPLYLLIFNAIYSIRYKKFNFIFNIILMLIAVFLGNCLHYLNWGISTGMLFVPDGETIYLVESTIKVNFISIFILGIIWQGFLLLIDKFRVRSGGDTS